MTLQIGQITFEKEFDLQVEMAVVERVTGGAAGECVGIWENTISGTLEKNVQQGLMRFLPFAVIS